MFTLTDALPYEFASGTWDDQPVWKHRDVEVVAKHCMHEDDEKYIPWPGKHKRVHVWYELANGIIVGWNENESRGWSFPIMRKPK